MSNDKDDMSVPDQVGNPNGDDRPDTRKLVEDLIKLQKDHDELKAQFYKDRGALEAKYEKLYQPLYDKVSISC